MAKIRRRAYPQEAAREGREYGVRGQLQQKPADEKKKDKKR